MAPSNIKTTMINRIVPSDMLFLLTGRGPGIVPSPCRCCCAAVTGSRRLALCAVAGPVLSNAALAIILLTDTVLSLSCSLADWHCTSVRHRTRIAAAAKTGRLGTLAHRPAGGQGTRLQVEEARALLGQDSPLSRRRRQRIRCQTVRRPLTRLRRHHEHGKRCRSWNVASKQGQTGQRYQSGDGAMPTPCSRASPVRLREN